MRVAPLVLSALSAAAAAAVEQPAPGTKSELGPRGVRRLGEDSLPYDSYDQVTFDLCMNMRDPAYVEPPDTSECEIATNAPSSAPTMTPTASTTKAPTPENQCPGRECSKGMIYTSATCNKQAFAYYDALYQCAGCSPLCSGAGRAALAAAAVLVALAL